MSRNPGYATVRSPPSYACDSPDAFAKGDFWLGCLTGAEAGHRGAVGRDRGARLTRYLEEPGWSQPTISIRRKLASC